MRSKLVLVCRVLIGVLFIVAAIGKLADLHGFALQVTHYRLAPTWSVNLLAMMLPWVELLAGLALVVQRAPRSGAWVTLGLLIPFTAAVAIAMARGLDFECGCFGTLDASRIGFVKLAQNAGMLALAAIASLERR